MSYYLILEKVVELLAVEIAAPVCNFSYESFNFFPKNFISAIKIDLGVFSLLVCFSHENIPSTGHIYLDSQEGDFSFGCIILIHRT